MKTDEPAATPNIPGLDQRFYELTLDRPTGIEFATDLSLKFVYVMEVKDNSPAQLSVTPVEKGDQLCGINGEECIGEVRSRALSPSSPLSPSHLHPAAASPALSCTDTAFLDQQGASPFTACALLPPSSSSIPFLILILTLVLILIL
eukprot:702561-Rhodomonas_salina.2